MNYSHILIVGAGQLGSRHLQALAQSKVESFISVVDPSDDALSVAKERFGQIQLSEKVKGVAYYTDLNQVPEVVDLCIIATSADHRLAVLLQLLENHQVRYILFEKVLFQSIAELDHANELLRRNSVPAWVNCPRRMFPTYQWLKQVLDGQKNISLNVTGNDWGLACNAIHFIDLWASLVGGCEYDLDVSELSSEVLKSTRPGYMEIHGTLAGNDVHGNCFLLSCQMNAQAPSIAVRIETDGYLVEIKETEGYGTILDRAAGKMEKIDFQTVYQSNLTQNVAEALIEHGTCELTSFADSMELHTPFITQLAEHFSRHAGVEGGRCPIT